MEKVEEYNIEEKINGITFIDYINKGEDEFTGSELILYNKFVDFPHLINKCGLVMIDKHSNYVINNDYRFHHLEIVEKDDYFEYNFITINEKHPNKKQINTYFKLK
jgi:hypothetical protein